MDALFGLLVKLLALAAAAAAQVDLPSSGEAEPSVHRTVVRTAPPGPLRDPARAECDEDARLQTA